jgi:hypothetical protein
VALHIVFDRLAEAINAVLDHPDTPADIMRVLGQAVDEIGLLYPPEIEPDYNNRLLARVAGVLEWKKGGAQ